MFLASFESLEAGFFRGLNRVAEPLVRAGLGAPVIWPAGAIVIETRGRKSGGRFNVPLLAAVVGDVVVVSTARRRSNWVKNITAHPDVRYWLGGQEREATAIIVRNGVDAPDELLTRVRCLADALKQQSRLFGTTYAILLPRNSP